MSEDKNPSKEQSSADKTAERAKPNKDAAPPPIIHSFENYQGADLPPKKK